METFVLSPRQGNTCVTSSLSTVAPRLAQRRTASRLRVPPRFAPTLATVALFIAMFAIGSATYPNFLSGQVFLNLLIDNTFLMVVAVGMTFVILSGGIDLSVGAVVALSMVVSAKLLQQGWNPAAVIVLVLLIGAGFGTVHGVIIQFFNIQPFIATLAGMFLARGLCYVTSLDAIPIRDGFYTGMAQTRIGVFFLRLPDGHVFGNVIVPVRDGFISPGVLIALLVVAVAFFVLHQTRFGRTVYALGGSENSAILMGLAVTRTKVLVYAVSGVCSAIGGILFSLYSLSGFPLAAVGMELDAIAAVVVGGALLTGGYGYVLGSVGGVLILGLVQTFIRFDGTLSSWWTRIFIGSLLLAFILLQRFFSRRTLTLPGLLGRHKSAIESSLAPRPPIAP
jgi:ribose/xylose/arabinose/galactoside ABC-type transport system permease subunit